VFLSLSRSLSPALPPSLSVLPLSPTLPLAVSGLGVTQTATMAAHLLDQVAEDREFFIDNLLIRIHSIIEMIWWTGLVPRESEFPFPGSLKSTFLKVGVTHVASLFSATMASLTSPIKSPNLKFRGPWSLGKWNLVDYFPSWLQYFWVNSQTLFHLGQVSESCGTVWELGIRLVWVLVRLRCLVSIEVCFQERIQGVEIGTSCGEGAFFFCQFWDLQMIQDCLKAKGQGGAPRKDRTGHRPLVVWGCRL